MIRVLKNQVQTQIWHKGIERYITSPKYITIMTVQLEMSADAGLPELEGLLTEDSKSRYQWLIDCTPITDHFNFPGGMVAYSLFKASRYCYVYGYYLASMVLGLAYIENTLSGLLIYSHRAAPHDRGLPVLTRKARIAGLIDDDIVDCIDRTRILRNNFPPFNNDKNSGVNELNNYKAIKVYEDDARRLMDIMIHLLNINPEPGLDRGN